MLADKDGWAINDAIQDDNSISELDDSCVDVLLQTIEAIDGKCRVTQLHITALAVFICKELSKNESSDDQQNGTRNALGALNSEGM